MAFPISCSACGATYRIPDALFASRFAGRETTIKCKKCSATISVDGTRKPPEPDVYEVEAAELITESVRPASVVPARSGSDRPKISSRPAAARPPSVTPRPWVGFKSIAIAPSAPKSQPPKDLTSLVPESEEPTLLARSVPVIPFDEEPTPAVAPRLSLLHEDIGPGPATVPAAGEPPPESVPRSRPPPLPSREVQARPSAARAPAPPPASAGQAQAPEPARAAPAAPASARASVSRPPRVARWLALGLGAAAATWWVGARDRDAAETRPAIAEHRDTALSAAPLPDSQSTAIAAPSESGTLARAPASAAPSAPATQGTLASAAPPTPGSATPGSATPSPSASAGSLAGADGERPPPSPAAGTAETRAAELALTQALNNAAKCQRGAQPAGTLAVVVAFAPTGQVISAELEADPPVTEAYQTCLLSHVRALLVPPFEGEVVRVRREVPPP